MDGRTRMRQTTRSNIEGSILGGGVQAKLFKLCCMFHSFHNEVVTEFTYQ